MRSYVLEISLRSPLTSAAGEGRLGLVDRDVVFDGYGLPVIPGRRLKGLWSEAYQEVVDAWTLCGQDAVSAQHIFGFPGQIPGAGAALLRVGDARLQIASTLEPWLAYLQHLPGIARLSNDEVAQYFASVRAQTAIDRRTGAAQEDSLRFTRTLRQGFVFHAPLRFPQAPDAVVLHALALGAAALQHMGTARTRGLGVVQCRLFAIDEDGGYVDLTQQAVADDKLRPILMNNSPATTSGQISKPALPPVFTSRQAPTHLLRYRLTLTAPAIIPVADSDPNTVVTRREIPGSNLWGWAAWHYLRRSGHTPYDVAFRRAFLDGELRFLSALPESSDPALPQDSQWRLLPLPHSIRQRKDTEQLIDFVELKHDGRFDAPIVRLTGRYARLAPQRVETQGVKTRLNYHHARASDRRQGRAIGAEVPGGGAFFVFEALDAGQRFQGAILGSSESLSALQTWLEGVGQVSIGRSRSAQYGGEARLEWLDDVPIALSDTTGEWDGFQSSEEDELPDDEERNYPTIGQLIITTLSPLLAVNGQGHPAAYFPIDELAARLGMEESSLHLEQSYTRTELTGGYISHLRLPRQQWPAIAAGSVFIFQVTAEQERITPQALRQLEHEGLGLRKGEGFGRIAINRHGHLSLTEARISQFDAPTNQPQPEAPISPVLPDEVKVLLRHVICRRSQESLTQWALKIAQDVKNSPSSALLGRLDLIIRQQRLESLVSLAALRKPAMARLKSCRLPDVDGLPTLLTQSSTLYDLLSQTFTHAHALLWEIAAKHGEELVEARYADERQAIVTTLVEHETERLVIDFLHTLLGAMRWALKSKA